METLLLHRNWEETIDTAEKVHQRTGKIDNPATLQKMFNNITKFKVDSDGDIMLQLEDYPDIDEAEWLNVTQNNKINGNAYIRAEAVNKIIES